MKILDDKGIPTGECDIPSNLPEYSENKKEAYMKLLYNEK